MKNGLRKEEIEHFRDNSKKPQKLPRFQPPKPQKNTRANTPRVIFITSRTNLTISEKPYRKNTDTRVSDSELNRHGLFPLPGGNCISTLLNGNQRTARFLQDKRR